MNSDLPGGLRPDELGDAGPGLEQLLRTFTADGTASELAGEQAALAMFRAHVRAPAGGQLPAPAAGRGSLNGHLPAEPAAQPAGTRPIRRLRPPGIRRGVPRLRIVVATAATLVGGFAAAAYAEALPAPVQHLAYQAFHYLGVPDAQHSHPAGGRPPTTTPGGHHAGAPSAGPHPAPSVSGGHSSGPAPGSSGTPRPSTSPGQGSPAVPPSGTVVLSAQAVSTQIPGGSAATINGVLSTGGRPDAHVYVRLMEHVIGRVGWVRVGRAQTSARGDVSFTTPALNRNAAFRLAEGISTRSSDVLITVVPTVSANLKLGPKGSTDYLSVITAYARQGDVVLLQVMHGGTWVTIRQDGLNAYGKAVFSFSATKLQGAELQVVLLATRQHGEATSPPVTVPPPA